MKILIKKVEIVFMLAVTCFVMSCSSNNRNENNLSQKDLDYIKKSCAIDSDETILLFETNAGFKGFKQGGNFITNKRITSYWIENNEKTVESALYNEIDSIKLIDRQLAVTLVSTLIIYNLDGSNFELFIEADSSRLYSFYNKTIEVWNDNKNKK